MSPVERIAVIRALALGDLLCAVPTLRALRHAHHDAEITLIGLPWAESFARRFSRYIDAFLEFPGWPGIPEVPVDPVRTLAFLAAAQPERFDLVVQLQGSGASINAFAVLLGGRQTVGFVPSALDAPPAAGTWLPYQDAGHEIHRLLRLAPAFGSGHRPSSPDDRLEFPLTDDDRAELARAAGAAGLVRGRYAVVHPGASVASRRWPVERFGDVVRALRDAGLRVVVTGTAAEAALTARVAAEAPGATLDLAGRTSLGALGVLVEGARIVVANDTGVSHIAAAMGTPSVVVFTGSDPGRWAPLDRDRHAAVGQGTPDGARPTTPAPSSAEVADTVRGLLARQRVAVP